MEDLLEFDKKIREILDNLKTLDKQLKELCKFRKDMLFEYQNEGLTLSVKNKSVKLGLTEIGLDKLLDEQIKIYENEYESQLNNLDYWVSKRNFDTKYIKMKDETLDLLQIPKELRQKMKELV